MRLWTRTAGIIFLFVSAVYTVSAGDADINGSSAAPPAQIDPFASSASNATSNSEVITIADNKDVDATTGTPTANTGSVVNNPDGTYGFHFPNNTAIVDVLQKIAATGQISIIPSKEVSGTVPAIDLYNVTIPAALTAILTTNGFDYEQKGGIIYVYSNKELADRQKQNLETQIYHLYYTRAADALLMIKPVLSPEAQTSASIASETGINSSGSSDSSTSSSTSSSITSTGNASSSGGGSSSDTGGDSYASDEILVVTDHPENQEQVRKVLAELDHKPKEILIEATILSAELTDNNSLGIDFSVLGGVSLNSVLAPPSTAGASAASGGLQKAVGGLTPASSSGTVTSTGGAGATGYTAANSGSGGLQVGVVYSNIAVFLNALESVTTTTVLANPKVLTLDKQQGQVHVGQTLYYYDTTVTQNAQTQAAQSLPVGITLSLRPFIEDNGFIRMEIEPEDSDGTIDANTKLPNTSDTEVSTNVMIQDGHTILIGGLFKETSSVNNTQTPVLGNIPVLGALFRQQADTTDRQEIIFLITPHIVNDDDALDAVSKEALKDIERLRVGVRQGMMFFSCERLAESSYEAAEAELAKPHPDLNLVRWHLDCATNLNPLFLEAIKLKEQVTGQELSASDNSNIRGFITREMLEEQKLHGNLPPTPTTLLPLPPPPIANLAEPQTRPSDVDDSAAVSNQPLSLQGN